ncbi:MAG: hypothetical protein IKT56_06405 [Clostridia bacterium]|nr:hypothetical protein [Clostridia bacterium]
MPSINPFEYQNSDEFFNEFENFLSQIDPMAIIMPLLGIFLVLLAIGITLYLLRAIAIYKMGKTVGAKAAWLAFIPVLDSYVIGRIAETPFEGKKPFKYSIILPLVNLISIIITYMSESNFSQNVEFFTKRVIFITNNYDEKAAFDKIFSMSLELLSDYISVILISSVASILLSILTFIALYKVYRLFAPSKAGTLLVCSFFFGIVQPIALFCLRNKAVCGSFKAPEANVYVQDPVMVQEVKEENNIPEDNT